MKIREKIGNPKCFTYGRGHNVIFRLGRRASHSNLFLGLPGNKTIPKIDAKTRNGLFRVGAAAPVRIGIHPKMMV